MGKKNDKIRDLYITNKTFRDTPKGYAWRRGEDFFDAEIKPIVKVLQDRKLDTNYENWLKNYLIIRLVSVIEDFFKTLVKRTVDDNDIQLSLLYDGETSMRLGILDEMFKKKNRVILTRGQIVANENNFANYKEINNVFTKLLKESNAEFKELRFDFFSVIKKLDWYNPYPRKFGGSKSMNKNWNNFERMFDVRNDIVHKMKDADFSTHQIASLCDNALNVMEAASAITLLSQIDKIVKIMKSKKL